MRNKFQRCVAVVGGVSMMGTPVIVENGPAIVIGWLATSLFLLFVGKAFTSQQKR